MKTPRLGPLSITFALVAILGGSLASPSASAHSLVHERPATVWGKVYAGPSSKNLVTKISGARQVNSQSRFIVNYTNFPLWAKNDVQAAIDIWSENFVSNIPITIEATWARSSNEGVLGSARPGNYFSNFSGAPDPTLWYPSALANALAGSDLDKKSPEILIQVNSVAHWNSRNDGTPSNSEYDLESVFIHELGHGLGFLSTDSYDPATKVGELDQPTAFDAYAQTSDGGRLSDLPSPSLELGQALTNTLSWSGQLGMRANAGVKPLLYTPATYEDGSSVSHLDEKTFAGSKFDSVMKPSLSPGEVLTGPGPLMLAMMEDLRNKPPLGAITSLPQVPRNLRALVGDTSAVITFDTPANVRAAQVSGYKIKIQGSGEEVTALASPVVINNLLNGRSYTFSIVAINSLGASASVDSNPVIPAATWKTTVLDNAADGKYLATTSFRDQPAILYSNSTRRDLKLAVWTGKIWRKVTVDGRGGSSGRTRDSVSGPVSLCVSGSGNSQIMHIFYTDLTDKTLRYATYDATSFKYEIVDGNGPIVQPFDQAIRVRTGSDVSISNACAVTSAGVQVFYRDDSQGILLGAFKGSNKKWVYELVDGDKKTGNRTTGDVAFHLRALAVGSKVTVIYDSVLGLNQQRKATSGEVRIATRTTTSPKGWSYQTIDSPTPGVAVTGYDVSLQNTAQGVIATWLTSTITSGIKPAQIRWVNLDNSTAINTLTSENFGAPSSPLSINNKSLAFGCQNRICEISLTAANKPLAIQLISNEMASDRLASIWVTINKVRYLATTIGGKLTLLKP